MEHHDRPVRGTIRWRDQSLATAACAPGGAVDTDRDGLLDIFEGTDANDGFDPNDANVVGDDGGPNGDYTFIGLADQDSDTDANEPVADRVSNDASPLVADLD